MPFRRVIFQRLATKEYREARCWYATKSSTAADKFRAAVRASVERIIDNPGFLAPIDATYRRVRVQGFPYILVFKQLSDKYRTRCGGCSHESQARLLAASEIGFAATTRTA